jgi:hypothetical protein
MNGYVEDDGDYGVKAKPAAGSQAVTEQLLNRFTVLIARFINKKIHSRSPCRHRLFTLDVTQQPFDSSVRRYIPEVHAGMDFLLSM